MTKTRNKKKRQTKLVLAIDMNLLAKRTCRHDGQATCLAWRGSGGIHYENDIIYRLAGWAGRDGNRSEIHVLDNGQKRINDIHILVEHYPRLDERVAGSLEMLLSSGNRDQ